ncbi:MULTISPECIES: hypothetical protein [unclassified Sulfitobacter]|uniref:hypothetical protein n=1 Tax=unclassified Sulfitobacter TaxID=196795 RepID=UPI0007C2439D|nr:MULTISPECIES: hypothetical protein [unclassified Sulfitobacter]KZY05264.1 hypothetical protein A3721_15145 [Sulfitobacter sp. HI0023]KZY26840.1 hypothetical protein A3728_14820 [Sulfitobacter sp. HI0040]KZZ62433.1 hypothetical protein A3764_06245 [Sulfitobacter sp. HI0129]
MKDFHSGVSVSQSIAPQAVTAALNGASVDLQGYNAALCVIDIGAGSGTSPTMTVLLQESDDDTTFTDVAMSDLLGGDQLAQITGTTDEAVYRRGYVGNKRYLRVRVSATGGTSPSFPMAAQVIRGHPNDAPVA